MLALAVAVQGLPGAFERWQRLNLDSAKDSESASLLTPSMQSVRLPGVADPHRHQ
jgi:hypothetical protein